MTERFWSLSVENTQLEAASQIPDTGKVHHFCDQILFIKLERDSV